MSGIEALLREVRLLDALASRSTWLSRLDPRATILVTVAFIAIVVSFQRYAIAALLPLAIFPVVLARLGDVPLHRVGIKVLMAMPFALMIGLFNPLFDPVPRMELLRQPIAGGWLSFISILVRVALTVGSAVVLVASMGIYRFCAGLDQLGVPTVLTTQLLFLHRYTLVLAGELGRMNLARELRSGLANAVPLAVYGSLLGHLLLRTLERAQRIHRAMLSRGFEGHMPIREAQRWRSIDTVFLVLCLSGFIVVRTTDLATLLGQLMLDVAS
ncbi:MAG: cobalt ECF transporter T component CbiQ [Sterolibacterium sp.]|nr:cobalt ECF transporter T component CbiQ [Sterolibacterium sp.]